MSKAVAGRWSSRCCFITVAVVLIPGPCAGWTNLLTRPPHGSFYTAAFPLVDVTVVPDDEIVQHRRVALLELIQSIFASDLMGLIDQLVILLVTECANDSQITALLNYILLTGDEARLRSLSANLPVECHNTGAIMTIAERIYNDGWLLDGKGKEEGNNASLDCCCRMGQILNGYKKITGLSTEQMQALEQPLPEIKRDP